MSAPSGQTGHELSAQIERILWSKTFNGSTTLRQLLTYLSKRANENSADPVRAREIAGEVFGRTENFDAQSDSIVRVHTGRLRAKLAEYYQNEGADDDLIVAIPRGHYALTWRHRPAAGAETHPAEHAHEHTESETRPLWRRAVLPVALVVATAAVSVLATLALHAPATATRLTPALKTFWSPLAAGEERTFVVFSNFRFSGSVETALKQIDDKDPGDPKVLDTFTSVGEVTGVYETSRILQALGKPVQVKRNGLLTWDEAGKSNLVFVGGPLAVTPLREIAAFREFEFRNHFHGVPGPSGIIRNLHPLAGEQAVYQGPMARPYDFDYAVIAMRPALHADRRVLVLAGITEFGTQAASEFVSREGQVDELLRKLGVAHGSPMPSFEALIKTKIIGGVPIQSDLVTIHKIQ